MRALSKAEIAAISDSIEKEPQIDSNELTGRVVLYVDAVFNVEARPYSASSADVIDVMGRAYRKLTARRWIAVLSIARGMSVDGRMDTVVLGRITAIENRIREQVAAGYLEGDDYLPNGALPR